MFETRETRIEKLKRQIEKIEAEVEPNYMLVKVVPDCGGGYRDSEIELVISDKFDILVERCEDEYNYTPALSDNRQSDNSKPCSTWYKIKRTDIQINV